MNIPIHARSCGTKGDTFSLEASTPAARSGIADKIGINPNNMAFIIFWGDLFCMPSTS